MKDRSLSTRKGSRNFYYREAVPADIVRIKKARGESSATEVWCSTGTADRRQAQIVAARLRARQHDEWDGIRRSARSPAERRMPHEQELAAICHGAYENHLKQCNGMLAAAISSPDVGAFDTQMTALERASWKFRVTADEDKLLPPVVDLMDSVIEQEGWHLPKLAPNGAITPEYRRWYGQIVDAVRDAVDVSLRGARGEAAPAPTSDVVRKGMVASQPAGVDGDDTTIGSLAKKFEAAERRDAAKGDYTIEQQSKAIELLIAFVGPLTPVANITKRQMAEFVDVLRDLPVKFASRADCKGLSLQDMRALREKDALTRRSPKTVCRELSAISCFYKWLIQRQYVEHNLTSSLFPKTDRKSGSLPPYSTSQLQHIFTSPLFVGCQSEQKLHEPGELLVRDWRFWIPLCAMHTGARTTEIAQLLVEDIRRHDDRWAFHFEESDDEQTTKSLKNTASRRVVPVHPKLVALGLLDYVEKRRAAGDQRLFPGLTPVKGQPGAAPSRAWREYLRRIGLKQGGDGFGLHSFRHTITDQLRLAGYRDDQIAIVLGHSKDLMTSHYGRMPEGTFKQRCDIIDSVTFEGVDLSPLCRCQDAGARP